jgi:uncharacterized cupin superfamily protein
MKNQGIIHFSDIEPEIGVRYPDEERRIKGAPRRTTYNYFANDTDGLSAGTWSADEGAYRIALEETKHEFFHILTGRISITSEDGESTWTFGPGETGIIPPGFRGVFEIIEAASKFYVVTERKE